MRALAVDLPDQLRTGFAGGHELETKVPRSTRHAVVAGMGGSAIAADLVQGLTQYELELGLEVVRGPALPKSLDRKGLGIFASYSGNTWETLAAYDEAGRRGALRLTASSGGELTARSDRDGVPHLQLPPGLPPRGAVGYMLGGLLGVLDPFFPESNDRRLQRAATRIAALQASYGARTGPVGRLAARIAGKVPVFLADSSLAGLVRRWKNQLEENAKRLAYADVFPELLHNAIVAWDAIDRRAADRWVVVLVEWPGQNPTIGPAIDYFDALLRKRHVATARVRLEPEDRLEALLTGVSFGDHLSLALAESAGVDPMPYEAITRLKEYLERR